MSEAISIFDIIKIGIGPSSSHTMGPWTAMLDFVQVLRDGNRLDQTERIVVELFGSLAKTGRGHGTHTAIIMGLLGEGIESTDVISMPARVRAIQEGHRLLLGGRKEIEFDPARHIVIDLERPTPVHANTLCVSAVCTDGTRVQQVYYSIGGGFIQREGDVGSSAQPCLLPLPYPIASGAELLRHCQNHALAIHDVVRANEGSWRNTEAINARLDQIFTTMIEAIELGCHTEGVLPGGLNVSRRARGIHQRLLGPRSYTNRKEWIKQIRSTPQDLASATSWITCFALAVNEVNASYGRIVTAPTNGACGVIPAVLVHYWLFTPGASQEDVRNFLLTAGEVGCIFKKNATISAAAGGCQAEIGVSSSMAAAGLTAVMGGSPAQCLMAAEIAMEHHLGMTCDPVGGLVQIPCIERNSMGAMKAITAAQMALFGKPEEAKVSLDDVVQTMSETARDMHSHYKETAEAGLAQRISVNLIEC